MIKQPLSEHAGYVLEFLVADKPVTFQQFLQLLDSSDAFVKYFCSALLDDEFLAIRWESRPVDLASIDQPYQCVILADPTLNGAADSSDFQAHLHGLAPDTATEFTNLGGDATLVVPGLGPGAANYCHLKSFLLTASFAQIHALFRAVARNLAAKITTSPLWLSTAGDGVPWLHIRIDHRPKYYHFAPYRNGVYDVISRGFQ